MRHEDADLVRWAKHIDVLIALVVAVLLLLSMPGCATATQTDGSVDDLAAAQGWTRDKTPRSVVIFRQGNPSEPCGKVAHGCEVHAAHASIITTHKHWCAEPAALVAHELSHSCGWRHD